MNTPNDIQIFDRNIFRERLKRIRSDFKEYDFLFKWGEDQILDRLSLVSRSFDNVLVIGERLTPDFLKRLKAQTKAQFLTHLSEIDEGPSTQKIIGDVELLPFSEYSFDLIISNLNCHTLNDLPGALIQLRKALKPDGLFIGSMFGGETLKELRNSLMNAELKTKGGLSPRVFPFADKQDMGALLQRAGYNLPVVDSDFVTVTYEHIFKLMKDLRGMGENNIIIERSKVNPGRALFFKAAELYHKEFAEEDGRIPATFEVIFLHGWAPHESQQKPLQPGSAQKRLADALNTQEIKTKN